MVFKQRTKCMNPIVYMLNKIWVDTSYYNVFAIEECAKTTSQRNRCNPITPMRKNSSIIRYFLNCLRRICGIHLSKKKENSQVKCADRGPTIYAHPRGSSSYCFVYCLTVTSLVVCLSVYLRILFIEARTLSIDANIRI